MFKERIVLIVVAVFLGIFFSIGLFYLYQKTKVIVPSQPSQKEAQITQPTPIPFSLGIDNPQDEEVFDKKIVQLSGKTSPQATVLVSLEDKELILTPGADGSFSGNITLVDGTNNIEVIAIDTNGKTIIEKRTLTYTTESF